MEDSLFELNSGPQIAYTFRTSLELNNITFLAKPGQEPSPFEFVSSNLTITSSRFEGSGCVPTVLNGGIIRDVSDNYLSITDSSFSNFCAFNGGAIYSGGYSRVLINSSSFSNCESYKKGGAIFSRDALSVTVKDSIF